MNEIFKTAAIVHCALGLWTMSFSTNYYVSTTGDNSNTGLKNEIAWRTIAYAHSVLAAGDTVFIATGSYAETVTITKSGAAGARIVYAGVGVATVKNVILRGADYITLKNIQIGDGTLTTGGGTPPNGTLLYTDQTSDYVMIEGCTLDGFNGDGIDGAYIAGSYDTITGCTIKNLKGVAGGTGTGANGLMLGFMGSGDMSKCSNRNTITQSTLQDMQDVDVVIYFAGDSIAISNNEIKNIVETDNEITHVDMFQTWTDNGQCGSTVVIERNYIHDNLGQLFYFNNESSRRGNGDRIVTIVFRNNVCHDIGLMGQTYGNSDPITLNIYNNIFHKVGYMYWLPPGKVKQTFSIHAFELGTGTIGEIRNNVFLECGATPTNTSQGWYSHVTAYTHTNNYVAGPSYMTKSSTFDESSPSINGGDPKFTNVGTHDYSLLDSTSRLWNAGAAISPSFKDKNSVSRPQGGRWDIGAYELKMLEMLEGFGKRELITP